MIFAYFKCPNCGTENIVDERVVGTRCRTKCTDKEIQERKHFESKHKGDTENIKAIPADFEYFTIEEQRLIDLLITDGIKRKGRYEA